MNERIKKLRNDLGLTQQEFADKLNIKRGTLANYEVGRNDPIDVVVHLICEKFNVNEHWLRTGEGEMFNELTEQEKIMKYTALLLKDKDSAIAEAIKNFIVTYEQLDNTSKKILDDSIKKALKDMK